jgi:UDP-2,3-diacylglucosamine hydrolase
MGHTLIASDLHLSAARPAIVESFFAFLGGAARQADAFYILGDLFDLWVGDDDPDPLNGAVLDGLAGLAGSGVRVFLMHGNRDFLFGRHGAARAGLELIADPTLVDLYGTPTLLMHGDTLCTDDVAYLTQRNRYRRPWIIAAFLALPRAVRVGIGQRLRQKSERTKRATPPAVMDAHPDAIARVLREHGYPRLVHGHTHRPARHEHVVDGQRCERWVLPDWYQRGGYLRCDASGCVPVALPPV